MKLREKQCFSSWWLFGVIFLAFLRKDSVKVWFQNFKKIFIYLKSVKLATLPNKFRLTFHHTLNWLYPILNTFFTHYPKQLAASFPTCTFFTFQPMLHGWIVFCFFPHFATNKHPFRVFIEPGNVILVCPPVTAQKKNNKTLLLIWQPFRPELTVLAAGTAPREIG